MRTSVVLSILLAAGCGSGVSPSPGDAAVVKQQEGQACSASPSDDPQLVCSIANDLICIATYHVRTSDLGYRQVFVCRLPCSGAGSCPEPTDVCCGGDVRGRPAGSVRACVPPAQCEIADGGS
jgi:hypothetical protein